MNQQAMLRKARQLQQEMLATQKEIDETSFTASVGPVTVVMKGSKILERVVIDTDYKIETEEDKELLEDSIVAACSKLNTEINNFTEEKMAKYKAFLGGF